jgi:hypothetical protein
MWNYCDSGGGAGSALTRVVFRSPMFLKMVGSSWPASVVHFFGTHHPSKFITAFSMMVVRSGRTTNIGGDSSLSQTPITPLVPFFLVFWSKVIIVIASRLFSGRCLSLRSQRPDPIAVWGSAAQ